MTDHQEPGSGHTSRDSDSDRRSAVVNGVVALFWFLIAVFSVWDTTTQEGLWRKGLSILLVLSTGHLAFHFGRQALQALRGKPQG